MPNKLIDVDLNTVARGAAPEMFNHEFKKVLESMRDLNTDPKAKRTITFKFVFEPLDSREEARVTVSAKTDLPSIAPAGGHMFVGRSEGQFRATTHDTQQEDLGLEKVTPIHGSGTKA